MTLSFIPATVSILVLRENPRPKEELTKVYFDECAYLEFHPLFKLQMLTF